MVHCNKTSTETSFAETLTRKKRMTNKALLQHFCAANAAGIGTRFYAGGRTP
jgi:hypothetical protein